MRYLGSSTIETDRLVLKAQTMDEQYYLWKVLMIPEVNKYFLTVPQRFREKLLDWNLQKQYYEEDIKHANDKDVFRWSIFLKETGECIGRLSCHERKIEDDSIDDPSIRGVGWLIDPKYQGQGYATEAAKGMIDYMFLKCEIKEIIYNRVDAEKEHMGLTNWKNSPDGPIYRYDVDIAKNYLNEKELIDLNRIVTMYLDYAELQAENHNAMTMKDWIEKLNVFLQFNGKEILHNAGQISAKVAQELAYRDMISLKLNKINYINQILIYY